MRSSSLYNNFVYDIEYTNVALRSLTHLERSSIS